ncbi:MAG: hypothetical protein AMJ53_13910 [Gammaproteobacteria bacterium SG8_11]|nr:MAG: hypothetical protein AMJ53_13910 [Gammaproteobacteria bacterium SG8_11]
MRFSGFIAVLLVTIAPGLIGCTPVHTQSYALQNQWLDSNYPDRASHLNKISTAQPYFRDDVIAGHIQLGMTVDEVLIATDTTPYGPKRYIGKFWCNNQTVDRCATTCRSCEGMLILKDQLVWFSGHSQPPTVINIEQRSRQESIFSSAPSQQFQIAQALYRNEIIQGMSFTDVSRVINSYTTKPQVFCDNDSAHISPTCDTSCKICRIEILSQSSNTVTKVIVLEPYLGQHRVTRIEQ